MLSVRALLADIVDYAGLFPPASLDMVPTVDGYAAYLSAPEVWMLGRLIVPVARLDEFEAAAGDRLRRREGGPAWRLSVLAGDDPAADAAAILDFQRRHGAAALGGGARIEALEMKARDARELTVRMAAFETGFAAAEEDPAAGPVEVFCELPGNADPGTWVEAVASVGASAKIRTGGITQEAIPPAELVAAFLAACAARGISFKATAGLHHPLHGRFRLTYEEIPPQGTMHGFLNVFLAAVLLARGDAGDGLSRRELLELLREEDPRAFTFDDTGAGWRDHRVSVDQIRSVRGDLALSFGSCSFTEPVDDLKEISLL